jgi:hypothetical protein
MITKSHHYTQDNLSILILLDYNLISICYLNSPLPYNAEYSEALGLGHGHLWESIILLFIVHETNI